jgi:hypothetical protein
MIILQHRVGRLLEIALLHAHRRTLLLTWRALR